MVHDKLAEAIQAGQAQLAETERLKREKEEQERLAAEKRRNDLIEYYKKNYIENDRIYDLIKEATAKGESELRLNESNELVGVINKHFTDIRARFYEEWGHFNSDEIEEYCRRVIITWKK